MAQQNKNIPRNDGFGTKEIIAQLEEGGATIYSDIEGIRARIIESLKDAGEKDNSNIIQLFKENDTPEMEQFLEEVGYQVKQQGSQPVTAADMDRIKSKHQSLFGDKKFTSSPSMGSMPFLKPPTR